METDDRVFTQYYRDVSRTTMPANADEERELFRRYHEVGDQEARQRIIEGGLRFVIKIARQYCRGNSEFLKTLIGAGNVGLLIAVNRYMPWVITCRHCRQKTYVPHPRKQRCLHCNRVLHSRDAEHYTTRFLTYAAWWISETIRTELYESSLIYVPAYRQKEQYRHKHPEAHGFFYVELDDAFEETLTINGEDEILTIHARELLYKLLHDMSDRQAYVVIAYYGLREDPKTLREIGQKLGICSERVRQIKIEAMAELRKRLLRMKNAARN